MITVLVVGGSPDLEGIAGRNPSLELLAAHGLEDALEKLGRNRRIDAVLVLEREAAASIVEGIREDNPAHPPIFLVRGEPPVPGTRALAADEPGRLIDLLLADLEG